MSTLLRDLNKLYTIPVTFGCEIEFYTKKNIGLESISSVIPEYSFIKERGGNQYEYHIGPHEDPQRIIKEVNNSIKLIKQRLKDKENKAIFDPKPFDQDFGNALQIQLTSLCPKFQNNIDKICSSFCESAKETFLAYAQTKADYARFDKKFMTPTHICFGPNNRSAMIRICGTKAKRIEIRTPSPISNLDIVFCTIIQQIILSDLVGTQKFARIYGNASDEQYGLQKIPSNIEEASNLFDEGFYKKIIDKLS
ncbi:MAG: hypothetical protein SFT91_05195 [Rickettsiaceae bacterium]|nr:hypothetical protein [Rickettsiaceae bacterium]